MPSRQKRWAKQLSCIHSLVLITSEKTAFTWSSTSQMLTVHFAFPHWILFYCSFTSLLKWRLHHDKMVRIWSHSMAVKALYHCDSLVKRRLVDFKCFLPDQNAGVEMKKSKVSWTEIMYFLLRWTPFGQDGVSSGCFYQYQYHQSWSLFPALFVWSPSIQQLLYLI